MQFWDISAPVSAQTPVYPGDPPYQQRWVCSAEAGQGFSLSELQFSPHIGTHADAPLHYASPSKTETATAPLAVGALDLLPFWGPCRVIHVIGQGPCIEPHHLQHAAAALPPRVLLRTCQTAAITWCDDFTALSVATVAWLAEHGVLLVGIDTPSVDPAHSSTLAAHRALLRHDMRVLENLVLDQVEPGDYELVALPLKLMSAEASPVRAVLRRLA